MRTSERAVVAGCTIAVRRELSVSGRRNGNNREAATLAERNPTTTRPGEQVNCTVHYNTRQPPQSCCCFYWRNHNQRSPSPGHYYTDHLSGIIPSTASPPRKPFVVHQGTCCISDGFLGAEEFVSFFFCPCSDYWQ